MLAAGAAPAIVHAANIMPVFVRRPSGLLVMEELIRCAIVNDIDAERVIARFDILLPGGLQLGVDQRFADRAAVKAFGSREIAVTVLDAEIRHRGYSWADLRPLPALEAA